MRYDITDMVVVVLLGFLIGLFVAGECLVSNIKDMRAKAVKVGAAEWVVDGYGKTTFTWKVDKK